MLSHAAVRDMVEALVEAVGPERVHPNAEPETSRDEVSVVWVPDGGTVEHAYEGGTESPQVLLVVIGPTFDATDGTLEKCLRALAAKRVLRETPDPPTGEYDVEDGEGLGVHVLATTLQLRYA